MPTPAVSRPACGNEPIPTLLSCPTAKHLFPNAGAVRSFDRNVAEVVTSLAEAVRKGRQRYAELRPLCFALAPFGGLITESRCCSSLLVLSQSAFYQTGIITLFGSLRNPTLKKIKNKNLRIFMLGYNSALRKET